MIARRSLLAAVSASLPGCAGAQRFAPEGFQQVSISRPEGTRHALVQGAPRGALLIVLLHGGMGSMHAVVGPRHGGSAAWPALARREGAVLLAPNGTDPRTGAGPGGAPLRFVTMEGGGHSVPSAAWPSPQGPLIRRLIGPACAVGEGTEMAWDFFERSG